MVQPGRRSRATSGQSSSASRRKRSRRVEEETTRDGESEEDDGHNEPTTTSTGDGAVGSDISPSRPLRVHHHPPAQRSNAQQRRRAAPARRGVRSGGQTNARRSPNCAHTPQPRSPSSSSRVGGRSSPSGNSATTSPPTRPHASDASASSWTTAVGGSRRETAGGPVVLTRAERAVRKILREAESLFTECLGKQHLEELDKGACGCCLDGITEDYGPNEPLSVGLIDSCPHAFHLHCISGWAERETTCPLCKCSFHCIAEYDVRGGGVRQSIRHCETRLQADLSSSSSEESSSSNDDDDDDESVEAEPTAAAQRSERRGRRRRNPSTGERSGRVVGTTRRGTPALSRGCRRSAQAAPPVPNHRHQQKQQERHQVDQSTSPRGDSPPRNDETFSGSPTDSPGSRNGGRERRARIRRRRELRDAHRALRDRAGSADSPPEGEEVGRTGGERKKLPPAVVLRALQRTQRHLERLSFNMELGEKTRGVDHRTESSASTTSNNDRLTLIIGSHPGGRVGQVVRGEADAEKLSASFAPSSSSSGRRLIVIPDLPKTTAGGVRASRGTQSPLFAARGGLSLSGDSVGETSTNDGEEGVGGCSKESDVGEGRDGRGQGVERNWKSHLHRTNRLDALASDFCLQEPTYEEDFLLQRGC